jgi:hypothetical protein
MKNDARSIIKSIRARGISLNKLAKMIPFDEREMRRVAKGEKLASDKTFNKLHEIFSALESDVQVRKDETAHLGLMVLEKIKQLKQTIDPKITLHSFAFNYLKVAGSELNGLDKGRVLSHHVIKKIVDAGCWSETERARVARLAVDMMTTTAPTLGPKPEESLSERNNSLLRRKLLVPEADGAYFLIAACKGADVPESIILATKFAAMRKGAQVFVQAVKSHDKPLAEADYPLDEKLHQHFGDRMYQSIQFGTHLWAADFKLTPQSDNVIGKMKKQATKRRMSIIVPHPTQQLDTVANGLSTNSRIVMSTGVVSLPAYLENYQGYNGELNHKLGGIYIEIKDGLFHARHFEYADDGSLVLDGIRYSPRGNEKKLKCKYMNVGDSHGGPDVCGDEIATEAILNAIEVFKPDIIGLNDTFEGLSISHHRHENISAEQEAIKAVGLLETELRLTKEYVKTVQKTAKRANPRAKLLMIGSNHNTHLHQYLDEGRFIRDKHNYKKAVELAYQYHVNSVDPLKYAIDPDGKLAIWPDIHEEIQIEGIEVNNHGHLGVNGARGGLKSDELAFTASTGGHSHGVTKKNGNTRAGTTSKLRMGYNQGPSSWAHGFEVIFEGGFRTLYIIIDGRYRADIEAPKQTWKEIRAAA